MNNHGRGRYAIGGVWRPSAHLADAADAASRIEAAAAAAPCAAAAPAAAPASKLAAVPVSSRRTVLWNQSLTPFSASLVTPRSYQGTRSLHPRLSVSSRKICTCFDARITGCAATLAMNSARCVCRLSIAALCGSSLGIRVFTGGAGTIMPSMDARSIRHSHSKSEYRRVTHPLPLAYCGNVVQ